MPSRLALVLALATVTLAPASEPPSIRQTHSLLSGGRATAEITADHLALSDELAVTVTIEGPLPVRVEPLAGPTASPGWAVRGTPRSGTETLPGGRGRWTYAARLSPRQPGELSLTLVSLRLALGPGQSMFRAVEWAPWTIRVTTSVRAAGLDAAHDIPDIDRRTAAPTDEWQWLRAIGAPVGAVAVLAAVGLGLSTFRRRRPTSPEILARQRLAELERAAVRGAGRAPHVSPTLVVSDMIRDYIAARFGIDAPRLSTEETLEAVARTTGWSLETVSVLRELLDRADRVKFAGESEAHDAPAAALGLARRLLIFGSGFVKS